MATDAEILAAKIKRDNAYLAIAPAKASMDSWYNALSKYNFTEGTNRLTCSKKVSPVNGEQIDAICCDSTKYSTNTCEGDKSIYNLRVTSWEQANINYENAKDEYDTLIEGKTNTDVSQLESDAKMIRTRYYVFGAIIVILIIAGVFIWYKFYRK